MNRLPILILLFIGYIANAQIDAVKIGSAGKAYDAKEYDIALESLNQVTAAGRTNKMYFYYKGLSHFQLKQYDSADIYLKKYLLLDLANEEIAEKLGDIDFEKKKIQRENEEINIKREQRKKDEEKKEKRRKEEEAKNKVIESAEQEFNSKTIKELENILVANLAEDLKGNPRLIFYCNAITFININYDVTPTFLGGGGDHYGAISICNLNYKTLNISTSSVYNWKQINVECPKPQYSGKTCGVPLTYDIKRAEKRKRIMDEDINNFLANKKDFVFHCRKGYSWETCYQPIAMIFKGDNLDLVIKVLNRLKELQKCY